MVAQGRARNLAALGQAAAGGRFLRIAVIGARPVAARHAD
jgi:hypothetical protein